MINKVAVCSRSFSSNIKLVEILRSKVNNIKINDKGLKLENETLIDFIDDCDAAIIGIEKVTDNIIKKLPSLKLISKYGVGIDNIDTLALKNRNIDLEFSKGTNKRSVSELVLSFALTMLREIHHLNRSVINGEWNQNKGNELSGSVFGIIGYGNIGQDLENLLEPFNCKILCFDHIYPKNLTLKKNTKKASLEEIFRESDIISLHIPLNETNKNLIDDQYLKLMKRNSILINTSRGGIVNEIDLYKALNSNSIAGAAFDVLLVEPPKNYELVKLKNFFITPHIGSSTNQAIEKMGLAAIKGIINYNKRIRHET